MTAPVQALQQTYESVLERQSLLAFAKNLVDYIDYVISVPAFNKVLDENIEQVRDLLAQESKLLKRVTKDTLHAKKKLLNFIERNDIDTENFKRYYTSPFLLGRKDILAEIREIPNDNYAPIYYLLFDIAANLKQLGHDKIIKEFEINSEERTDIYRRAKSEPPGDFIFSRMLDSLLAMRTQISRERRLNAWSAFTELMEFRCAFEVAKDDESFLKTFYREDFRGYPVRGSEVMIIAEDIKNLGKTYRLTHTDDSSTGLKRDSLNDSLKLVHKKLLRVAVDERASDNHYWIVNQDGKYYFNGKEILIKSPETDYFRIFEAVFSLIPTGGKITYKQITEICRARKLKGINRKRVQRALTGKHANFFRYIDEIPFIVGNRNLFTASRNGKHLEFNNKK